MKISIVGSGRVAFHLLSAFDQKVAIVQVIGRNETALKEITREFQVETIIDYTLIKPADVFILCISDDAISQVAKNLKKHLADNTILIHTSGTRSLLDLENCWSNTGIFYPLQSFSKESKVNFENIPILISSSKTNICDLLNELALQVTSKVFIVSDEDRKRIHLAAVVINNHVNHLVHLAKSYCEDHNLSFDMLRPLLTETIHKIDFIDPLKAQTGPALRGDESTIDQHLELLEAYPLFQEIYQTISDSITLTYHS